MSSISVQKIAISICRIGPANATEADGVIALIDHRLIRCILALLVVFVVTFAGCTQSRQTPAEVNRLLDELNAWDKKELVAFMGQGVPPSYIASGETNVFVETTVEKINRMGFDVSWAAKDSRFVLVDRGDGVPRWLNP